MTKTKQFLVEGQYIDVSIEDCQYMTCTENGHSKFWIGTKGNETSTDAPIVVLQWGKIGSAGHTELKRFKNVWRRDTYFNDRVWDKRSKKYVTSREGLPALKPVAPKEAPVTISTANFAWDLF